MESAVHLIEIPAQHVSFLCDEQETLLSAMVRQKVPGVWLGCQGGGCGICKIRILEGSVSKGPMCRHQVSEAEEAQGYTLACISLPRTRIALQLVGFGSRTATILSDITNLS